MSVTSGAWAELALGQSETYSVDESMVIRFVLDHLNDMPPTLSQPLIQRGLRTSMVASVRRAHASVRPVKKAAITRDILEAMLATCDNSLRGVMDRAILSVGFAAGGRRRSEIANFQVENLESIVSGYLLHLDKNKTDQEGEGLTVPVLGTAAHALREWLVRSGLYAKAPSFAASVTMMDLPMALKGQTINYIVKQRVKKMGLDPTLFGAHSLRRGFITEAARAGSPVGDAMALTGHKSIKIASGYYRESDALDNSASRLLDIKKRAQPR